MVRPVAPSEETRPVEPLDLEASLAKARSRIPPLWPLKHFVAVNPFLGLRGMPFAKACAEMQRIAGADMVMSRHYYRALVEQGRITDGDLENAMRAAHSMPGAPRDLATLRNALESDPIYESSSVATVAEVVDRAHGLRTEPRAVEEIAKWCAAYWDEGQAAWRMPWRALPLYSAWRAAAHLDRTPDVMGFQGFRDIVQSLPDHPVTAIESIVEELALSGPALDAYLHRALFSIRGWAAYARYIGWYAELDGKEDKAMIHVLAIRLAWDYALFVLHDGEALRTAWTAAVASMAKTGQAELDRDLWVDTVLQTAFEASFQRDLIAKLLGAEANDGAASVRPSVQAAFCIDVRSEVFRRALETVEPRAQTIGFAGFFGFPIEYVPIGQVSGTAQCPVLLKPRFVVRETVTAADEDERTEILGLRLLRRRASKAWKSFKGSAVSSFVYVETAGLTFAAKLVGDATGLTRPVTHPSAEGLDWGLLPRIGPEVEAGALAGRSTGFTLPERIDTAETMLRAMSLREGFARLVMLTGHGSTTVNNPHASGYDCGACGGNPGEANARVAASILNDPNVRAGLADRDIVIPNDTWFLGCLHDTTTDEITIFDREQIPASHSADLQQLEGWLEQASELARAERALLLGVPASVEVDAAIVKRSRDWSQVRPEWGLAGNAAFIAAPRQRTRSLDLGGRVFLHDYDWRRDEEWRVLELILTAPMVVASWINLQYYGSTVSQKAFGSGNKVLHNVVGTLGVLEGNAGDLRVGLPLQTLHDGKRFVHEPLRLSVFIEAPPEPIDTILRKHEGARELVDNGWVHLFALTDDGRCCLHRTQGGAWVKIDS
ncbi:MAG: hypothetical protein AMJ62_12190 [Myxococcales bacterium SG8_38]|nr:MAG: hypothetical protein AMJ62_12190 [Myxococcales bacterium SG8_38]